MIGNVISCNGVITDGRKKLRTTPVIFKTYYVFVNAKAEECKSFKKCAYNIAGDDSLRTLIHYRGDSSVAITSAGPIKPHIRLNLSICFESL